MGASMPGTPFLQTQTLEGSVWAATPFGEEVEPSPSLCEGVLNAPELKFLSMLATMIGPLAPPENLHSKSGGLGNGALRPPQPGGK